MKANKISTYGLLLCLALINYLVFYVLKNDGVIVGYQISLVVLSIVLLPKKRPKFQAIVSLIICTMAIFVPYINSNLLLVNLSYLIYYFGLFYSMVLLSKAKDDELLIELYCIIDYPIKHCADLKCAIKVIIKGINTSKPKEYKQIIYALLAAVPTTIVIAAMLISSDQEFLNIINVSIIWDLLICLALAVLYVSLLEYYKLPRGKHYLFLEADVDALRQKYLKYYSFANVFLTAILPVQIIFIIFEIQKVLKYTLLYGENVSNNYSVIILVVIINTLFNVIFYYFYKNEQWHAKLIRNCLFIANYLLLLITAMQVVIYVINTGGITEKRYYALISIFIMYIMNIVLQIKINKKAKNIIKYVYVVILLIFTSLMMIDVDSVVYQYNLNHEQNLDQDYLKELTPIWK